METITGGFGGDPADVVCCEVCGNPIFPNHPCSCDDKKD